MKNYWEWEPVFAINPKKSALLVIDMQNGFLEENAPLEVPMAREQIPNFKKLLTYCRENSIPVIFTKFCITPDFNYSFYRNIAEQRGLQIDESNRDFWDGTHEAEIFSEISPLPEEKIIEKFGYDCFAETSLQKDLQLLGIENLLITGTVLNWCVDSTVRAAYHLHYDVTVISDAVSAYEHGGGSAEDWHKMELNLFAEAFGRVVNTERAILEMDRFLVK